MLTSIGPCVARQISFLITFLVSRTLVLRLLLVINEASQHSLAIALAFQSKQLQQHDAIFQLHHAIVTVILP